MGVGRRPLSLFLSSQPALSFGCPEASELAPALQVPGMEHLPGHSDPTGGLRFCIESRRGFIVVSLTTSDNSYIFDGGAMLAKVSMSERESRALDFLRRATPCSLALGWPSVILV